MLISHNQGWRDAVLINFMNFQHCSCSVNGWSGNSFISDYYVYNFWLKLKHLEILLFLISYTQSRSQKLMSSVFGTVIIRIWDYVLHTFTTYLPFLLKARFIKKPFLMLSFLTHVLLLSVNCSSLKKAIFLIGRKKMMYMVL